MKAIDAVKAHYSALGIRHIDVPEWLVDGKPLRVHWRPLTLRDRAALLRGVKDDDGGGDLTRYAAVVAAHALDAEGNKLFDFGDRVTLARHAESTVVTRVALAMLDAPSLEVAEKN